MMASPWVHLARALAKLFLALAVIGPAAAQQAPAPDDAVLNARVKAIADELRCLVCQNQTIADSHAELAIDLRNQVIAQVRAGKTDEQIKQYMVDRYGEFVLFRPRMNATNILLWAGPFVLLVGGALLVMRIVRANRVTEESTIDDATLARVREALANRGGNEA
jgi:cytochrome c-type biogenesis protein CcmH